jgi:hypothetical protein
MAFTRYAHIKNIGKPNYLKVFGVGKSKGIKRIAKIAKCRTCSEKSTSSKTSDTLHTTAGKDN